MYQRQSYKYQVLYYVSFSVALEHLLSELYTNHDETLCVAVHFDWKNLEKAGSLVPPTYLRCLGFVFFVNTLAQEIEF